MKVVGCHRAQGLIHRVGVQDVEYIQVVGSGFGKLTPGFLPLFATARSSSVSGRHLAFDVWSYGRAIRQKKETFVTTNTGGDRDRSQMHGGHWASPPKRRVRVFGVGCLVLGFWVLGFGFPPVFPFYFGAFWGGSEFGGLGSGVWGLAFVVWFLVFLIWALGFGVWGLGFGVGVWG